MRLRSPVVQHRQRRREQAREPWL